MSGFHDVRFPERVGFGARGGPERLTEIVRLVSGAEERNARRAHSRRRWNAGYGVRGLRDLEEVLAFFEARLGRLHAFRFRDPLDHRSARAGAAVTAFDQVLGTGDGARAAFQLVKRYESGGHVYDRPVRLPAAGTVRVGVDGAEAAAQSVDALSGLVILDTAPSEGAVVTAGFEFDVPVRFDTDFLEADVAAFEAGEIPSIPLIEVAYP